MSTLFDDLRLALRDLRHRPMFAATVVLTLALGIGATTAAFALVDAVFLTRLPVQDQGRLVTLWARYSAAGDSEFPLPWDTQRVLVERQRAFVGVAAWRAGEPWWYAARDGDRTVPLGRTAVSGNFFDVLGVRPQLGRLLRPDDDAPGGPDVLVLSDKLWRREFGGDPRVVGRVLFLVGGTYQVIGVAPPEFSYPFGTDAWSPVVRELHNRWGTSPDDWANYQFGLVARLQPGATLQFARVDLEAALRADSATGKYGRTRSGIPPLPTAGIAERYVDVVLGREVRPSVIVLFCAVALVLLIACTNVTGLLVARGIARAPELDVRAALGAGWQRLASQLLVESLLLGVIGGVIGVATAATLVHAVVALAPPELPMVATAHLDLRVVAFAAAITAIVTVGTGLAPALRGARAHGRAALRTGNRSVTGGPLARLTRQALVAAQVALALAVLSGAGLLGATVLQMQRVALGFDASHLLFAFLDQTPWAVPKSPDSLPAYFARWHAALDRVTQQLPNVPGLSPLTSTLALPFSGNMEASTYVIDDQGSTPAANGSQARVDYALDDYFNVLRIPILRGRSFTRQDDSSAPPVAVVNKYFADHAWPGQNPLGRRIGLLGNTTHRRWSVVGEAADTRYNDLSAPRPTVYLPTRQAGPAAPWYVVRTRGDPARAVALLEQTLRVGDPAFGASRIETGPALLAARLARPRALAALFAALSATALLLAAIGLFGVLSGYVRERRRELAVRSALGATPAQLRSLVLAQTLGVAAAGIACGVPLALGSSNMLRTMLTDVRPASALTITAMAVVLLAVVAAATYGPMVRATRVDARTTLAGE